MKITRLKMINWRRYYGEHDIKFAVDKKRNITIFYGENNGAKTSLMCAIKWTFFGTLTSDLSNPKNLVNDDAQKENINKCSSTIFFSHESNDYKITRTYYQETKKNEFLLWRVIDGLETSEQNGDSFIRNIFPKEICEYFFFQGEGKSHLQKHLTNKNNSIKKPVQDILGFQIAEKLRASLKRYISDIEKENDGYNLTDKKQKLIDKIKIITDALEDQRKKVKDKEAYLETIKKKKIDTEKKLDKIEDDFPDCKDIVTKIKIFKDDIEGKKKSIELAKNDAYHVIYKYGWVIFSQEFLGKTYDHIDDQIIKGELPGDHNVNFLNNLIDAGICICDRKINSEQADILEKKKATTITQVVQLAVQDIVAKRGLIKSKSSEAPKKVKDVQSKLHKLREELVILKDNYDVLKLDNEELQNIGYSDLLKVVENTEEEIQKEGGGLKVLKDDLEEIIEKEKVAKEEKASMQEMTPKVTENLLRISFAQEVIKYIDDYLAKANQEIKGYILSEINSYLSKYDKSNNSVEISDEYTVAFSKGGSGSGHSSIYALLITCVMISLSIKRKDVKDPILRSSAEFPFLLDSPFGELDEGKRRQLPQLLQPVAEQLIIFVSSTQLTEMEKELLKEHIGKQYLLQMHEIGDKTELFETPLKAGGKSFDRTLYNQVRKTTEIILID